VFAFWKWLLERMLEAAEPEVILEVGAGTGRNTSNLATFAESHDCVVHVVDPEPGFDVDAWRREHPALVFHRARSVDALPEIGEVDVALLDGDHNWFTVHRELELVGEAAAGAARPFPLTFVSNVSWPYARRDSYADPPAIPGEHLHPHRKAGIVFGEAALSDERGINGGLFNAEQEGTPRNGVLTAVEDFVAETGSALALQLVPGYSGLAVLASRDLLGGRPRLRVAFDRLMTPEFLYQHTKRLERVHTVLHASYADQRRELREANRRLQRLEAQLPAAPAIASARAPTPSPPAEAPPRPAVHRPLELRVAFVGSRRLAGLLAPSCASVMPVPERSPSLSGSALPELLLVEAHGEDDPSPWSHEALTDPEGPLAELLAECRRNGVPSALWVTTDHESIAPFLRVASLFDERYVADPESARLLAGAVPGALPPGVLPWAMQPALHRAPDLDARDGAPLYVGGWRSDWPDASQRALRTLLDAALRHGLRIAVPAGERAEFPPEYGPCVEAGVEVAREVELMQRAPVVIAFHSAVEARTFVPRIAFEAVACGAAVIARPNWGMHHYFGDTAARAAGAAEAEHEYALLLSDETARRERVRTGQGFLVLGHTYDHRLATIASGLGRRLVPQPGGLQPA
jgi:hypothetical protein